MFVVVLPLSACTAAAQERVAPDDPSERFGTPHPDAPEGFEQYAFMIGDFTCDVAYKEFRDGAWIPGAEGTARWTARYVMNGRAILDDFVDDWGQAVNVRTYDEESGTWSIHYIRERPEEAALLEARWTDGQMVMVTEKETPGGFKYTERVAFTPAGPGRYLWTQEVVYSPENVIEIARIDCELVPATGGQAR